MSGQNQFQPFAKGNTANVLSPTDYAGKVSLLETGFQAGVARSQDVNTPLRQATFVAAAIAQIIANSGVDAMDDGDLATFITNFLAAIYTSSTTPAQFDNDTSLATTAFVQRALGNFQTGLQLNADATLTAADVGKVYQLAAANVDVVLPLLSTTVKGAAITFVNNGSNGCTINVQGTNKMIVGNQGNLTTIPLKAGDSIMMVNVDGGNWFALSGSALIDYSNSFTKSIGANGYQKLPGGLIIQWGELGSPGTSGTLTFPLAFPNSVLSIATTMNGTVSITSTLSFNLTIPLTTGVPYQQSSNVAFSWIAIGY